MKILKFLAVTVALLAIHMRAAEVTLVWDANSETNLAGYRVWCSTNGATGKFVSIEAGLKTTLTVSNIQAGSSCVFYATAFNKAGLESEPSARVSYNVPSAPVGIAPVFVTQPESRSVHEGKPFSLSVTANGTEPLSFQWYRNGLAIQGATWSTFTVAEAKPGDAGSYLCRVANPFGIKFSNSVAVTVETAPAVIRNLRVK